MIVIGNFYSVKPPSYLIVNLDAEDRVRDSRGGCKGYTWGNFRNFECLYLIGVGCVAGGYLAVVVLEIIAWHPAASTEKTVELPFPAKSMELFAARISEFRKYTRSGIAK